MSIPITTSTSCTGRDVHGGEVCGAIVSGLVGPDAPDKERWETLWHYMQGGPGVFKGDLYFYKLDGDIRGRVAQIDTRRCPLFLLSANTIIPARRRRRWRWPTAFPAARSPS